MVKSGNVSSPFDFLELSIYVRLPRPKEVDKEKKDREIVKIQGFR